MLLSSSILFYCWSCCCTVWGFPCETASKSLLPRPRFGSATPAMSLSNLLPSSSPWSLRGRVWREALICFCPSAVQRQPGVVSYQDRFSHSWETQHSWAAGKKVNLETPSQAEPVSHCSNLSVQGHGLLCTSELLSGHLILILLKIEVIMKRECDKLVSWGWFVLSPHAHLKLKRISVVSICQFEWLEYILNIWFWKCQLTWKKGHEDTTN